MKKGHFRNTRIWERLNAAARKWESASSDHRFQLATRRISKPITSALWTLLYVVLASLFISDHWYGDVFLTFLLPVTAAMTLSELRTIVDQRLERETTYLLPFTVARLDRQNRSDWISPLINGSLAAALLGGATGASGSFLVSALVSTLIFVALLGILSISFNAKFLWVFPVTLFGFGALTFLAFVSSTVLTAVTPIANWLPWHLALGSQPALWALLVSGLATLFLTRKKWMTMGPYPRDCFYEGYDEQGVIDEIFTSHSDLPDDVFEIPAEPKGILESILWSMCTPKEKVLLKIAGATQSNWLKQWLIITSVCLGIIWIGQQDWYALKAITGIASMVALVGSFFYFVISCPFWVSHFTTTREIGPLTHSCFYQTFPIGLPTLERLCLKEIMLKAPFLALTTTGTFLLFFKLSFFNTPSALFFAFLNSLPFIVIFLLGCFWRNSFIEWLPKPRKFNRSLHVTNWLMIFFACVGFYVGFKGLLDSDLEILVTSTTPGLYVFLVGLPFILFVRANVTSHFKVTSGDLIKVEDKI